MTAGYEPDFTDKEWERKNTPYYETEEEERESWYGPRVTPGSSFGGHRYDGKTGTWVWVWDKED